MRHFYLLPILALALTAGCRSQAPTPSPQPSATLNWTAASTCVSGAPACTYVVTRAVCPTPTTCPALTSTAWVQLNSSNPTSSTTFKDTAPPQGSLVSYVVTNLQNGLTGQTSGQSNNGVPSSVPIYPGTPGTLTTTVATATAAPIDPPHEGIPEPTTASVNAVTDLVASVR